MRYYLVSEKGVICPCCINGDYAKDFINSDKSRIASYSEALKLSRFLGGGDGVKQIKHPGVGVYNG
jgi:hypothetical protein